MSQWADMLVSDVFDLSPVADNSMVKLAARRRNGTPASRYLGILAGLFLQAFSACCARRFMLVLPPPERARSESRTPSGRGARVTFRGSAYRTCAHNQLSRRAASCGSCGRYHGAV